MTEFEVQPTRVLVPRLTGYGVQFNHHVFAKISREVGVTEQNVGQMESKVLLLRPQFVRIFFHHSAFADEDRMSSFQRAVELAERANATINITWQGGKATPERNMARFAEVLAGLANDPGGANVKWVTVSNEVNRTKITPAENEAMYRMLDRHLRQAGVREHLRFMGGDLTQEHQERWFTHMGTHMQDILDAYSVHIYWDYRQTQKFADRLDEVRRIVAGLPQPGRKPLFVTEFGVRGIKDTGLPIPGRHADGTPIGKTNVAGFQQAWFNVLAAQRGYPGTAKWDCYFGKYDKGIQAHYAIGRPQDGWPLFPAFSALRLFAAATEPDWHVVDVKHDGPPTTKQLAAYTDANGQRTVIGLDTRGAQLNGTSSEQVGYDIGGLPPNKRFQLVVWNRNGHGHNTLGAPVTTSSAGVAHVVAPLHSVFALTTKQVSV